ncbi:MAG: PKD domain-containing protein, partial [Verrucomicrobiota bacterium]
MNLKSLPNRMLLLLGGLLSFAALGEGTFNASNNFTPAGASQKAFLLDLDGTPLNKNQGRVELLLLNGLQTLTPNGALGEPLTLEGLFFVNGLSVASATVGDSVDVILRAWDASTGDTYAQALSKAETLIRVTNLGGGLTPPATLALNSNFRGLRLQFTPYSVVQFANGVFGANRLVLGLDGAPLSGGSYVAQLFMDTRTGLVTVEGKGDGRFGTPGLWNGGLRELAGISYGQTVQLEVRVWDRLLFSSYEAAVNGGGITGTSELFDYTYTPSGTPSGPSSWMANLTTIRMRSGPTPPPLLEGVAHVDPVEGETVIVEPKVTGGTAPLRYLWQLPNGVQWTNRTVTFPGATLRPGLVDFNLTVTDADGRATPMSPFRLDVSNRAPVIRSGTATGALEGQSVSVSGTVDYAWPVAAMRAVWRLADGRTVPGLSAVLPVLPPGRHQVELTVSELGLEPVYDSLDSVGSPAGSHLATEETGDEVVLTRTNALLHEVAFAYFADLSGLTPAERASAGGRLRLYLNDGPTYPGTESRMPGTLLYESPVFGLNSGYFLQRLTELNVQVPDRATWTVAWTNVNQTAGRTVGLVLTDPTATPAPSNRGSSDNAYWVRTPERWERRQFADGRPVADFASRVTAIGDTVALRSTPWPVLVEVTNVPPTLVSLAAPSELVAGQVGEFRAVATDPGTGPLTYAWEFGDGTSAEGAAVTHAFGTVGTFKGLLRVRDPQGAVVTAPFSVTTTVERRPLAFVGTPPVEATQGQRYETSIAVNPPGIGQSITLKAATLPAWLTWISTSAVEGRLEGIPGQPAIGPNQVVLEATDGASTQRLEFVVVVADVNDPPTLQVTSALVVPVRKGIADVPVTVSDPEGVDDLVLSAVSGDPLILPDDRLVVGGSGRNRTLSILPTAGGGGRVTVTLTVRDASLSASAPVTVTLLAPTQFTVAVSETVGGTLGLSPAAQAYEEEFPLQVTALSKPGWALRRWLGFPEGPLDAQSLERLWRVSTNVVLSGEFADVAPPVVEWLTPSAGLSPSDVVTLSGQVRDNDRVASARLVRAGLPPKTLELTSGRFQIDGVRLDTGENRFVVEALDAAGNGTTNDLVVVWSAGSVLVVGDAPDAREGQRVVFPIQLQNRVALSGMTFNLMYRDYVDFLTEPQFETGSGLPGGLVTVNQEVPGVVRVTIATAGDSLPAGRHLLGTLSLRVRSLFSPIGLQAYLDPELLEVSNELGDPVPGVDGVSGQVRLLPRRITG